MRHGQWISISGYYRNNIYGFTSRRKVDDARLPCKEKNVNVGVFTALLLKSKVVWDLRSCALAGIHRTAFATSFKID